MKKRHFGEVQTFYGVALEWSFWAMRFAKALDIEYGTAISTGPSTNAAPGWTRWKMRNWAMMSKIIAIATKSRTDANALRKRFDLCSRWCTSATKNGGNPACESFLPSRMPSRAAAMGCKIKRKRPIPESRANISSKNCWVNRYGCPVRTSLPIAPGSAANRIAMATAVRIELRESEIFIFGADRKPEYRDTQARTG